MSFKIVAVKPAAILVFHSHYNHIPNFQYQYSKNCIKATDYAVGSVAVYVNIRQSTIFISYFGAYDRTCADTAISLENFKAYASKINLNKNHKNRVFLAENGVKVPQNQTFPFVTKSLKSATSQFFQKFSQYVD